MLKKYLCKTMLFCLLLPTAGQATELDLEDINFPFDSYIVLDDLKQLPKLAEILNNTPKLHVEIMAHADAQGPEKYNIKLSQDRAIAVKNMLISQGVDPNKIIILAYGEKHPKSKKNSREAHFVNRRVTFNIYELKGEQRIYYYRDNENIMPFPETTAKKDGQNDALPKTVPSTDKEYLVKQDLTNLTDGLVQKIADLENTIRNQEGQNAPAEMSPPPAPSEVVQTTQNNTKSLGSNLGRLSADLGMRDGDLSGSIEGELFMPVHDLFALQGGDERTFVRRPG